MPTNTTGLKVQASIDLKWLRDFVQSSLLPSAGSDDLDSRFNFEIYQELHRAGFLNLVVPTDDVTLPLIDVAWTIRELAYGSMSAAVTVIGHNLGFSPVLLYGNSELRQNLIAKCRNEFALWSFAMTEAEVGSDLLQTQTTARETDDGFELNGEKNFITNATYSSHISLYARHIDREGKDLGISCFYIPYPTKGLERGPSLKKYCWRAANTGSLILQKVRIPRSHLLGQPGQGLKILTHSLNRSKTLLAAAGVGLSVRALDLVKERLSRTKRFGNFLIEEPSIRHALARLYTQREAAWLMVCQAADAWEKGPATKEASMAKLFSGQAVMEITNRVVELFASRGLIEDNEASRLMRDAKGVEIVEGPSLIQELLIAKDVLRDNKAIPIESHGRPARSNRAA